MSGQSARQGGAAAGSIEQSELGALLNKEFRPKSDQSRSEVENAVKTLAAQALEHTQLISDDTIKTLQGMIAEIDKKLTEQVNEILHHEQFQSVESSWRGLHYLVNNTETDPMLQIRVLNISKKELHKTLKRYKGTAWDQSPLFKRLYEDEYGTLGGKPYACLIGDYYFDHSAPDVETLGEISQISAAMHAPFIASYM